MVARGVHKRFEAGRGGAIQEPPSRREVGLAQARPVDAPAGDGTDPRERLEVVAHPVAVDAHVSSPVRRSGPGPPRR